MISFSRFAEHGNTSHSRGENIHLPTTSRQTIQISQIIRAERRFMCSTVPGWDSKAPTMYNRGQFFHDGSCKNMTSCQVFESQSGR